MSATKTFIDYVRSDAELRRAFFGLLDEQRVAAVESQAESPSWDIFQQHRGALNLLSTLKNLIQMEEREHAARRDYDDRSGRPR